MEMKFWFYEIKCVGSEPASLVALLPSAFSELMMIYDSAVARNSSLTLFQHMKISYQRLQIDRGKFEGTLKFLFFHLKVSLVYLSQYLASQSKT